MKFRHEMRNKPRKLLLDLSHSRFTIFGFDLRHGRLVFAPGFKAEGVKVTALLHCVGFRHFPHHVLLGVLNVIGVTADKRRQCRVENLLKLSCKNFLLHQNCTRL